MGVMTINFARDAIQCHTYLGSRQSLLQLLTVARVTVNQAVAVRLSRPGCFLRCCWRKGLGAIREADVKWPPPRNLLFAKACIGSVAGCLGLSPSQQI